MNVQELVINLKVISSLGINQKLITKNIILNIEPLSIIPEFARRWFRQDNRTETIIKINNVIDQSISYLKNIPIKESKSNGDLSSTVFYECSTIGNENNDEYINITKYLILCKKGLDNLKKTYSPCIKTVSEIDWIIDKIDNAIENYVSKI